MRPFIVKYRPVVSKDVPQPSGVAELKKFVQSFPQKKKALLIYGPSGTGKTSAVQAVAGELGYEIIETNASEFRTEDQVRSKIGNAATQHSLFGSNKIILIDEVDGVSGHQDRGGVSAVVDIIKSTKYPIVLTANDPFDKKFSSLRSACSMLEFGAVNYLSIKNVLKSIADKESIVCSEDHLKSIARRAGGDIRSAINDFQSLVHNKELIGIEADDRSRIESIMQALVKVLKAVDVNVALSAFDNIGEDIDECFFWLDENIPKEYKGRDLVRAYDVLSKADVYRGRILRRQHWRFLSYANVLLTAGIASSKDEKPAAFVKYTPTNRILKIWQSNMKYAKRKSIAVKLARKTHSSFSKVLQDSLPYLKRVNGLADDLDLDEEESKWLSS